MEIIAKHQQLDCDMRKKIEDIELSISIREIANDYFHKSASWLYHKLDGIDGNGGKGGFSAEEKETFKNALFDISSRIRKVAENV
ncbi:MAG: DUF5053 domain-containing protein [Prevotella bivia]|uniref:DUF5053 domain-containing protein n=1 Tax=Prevotella bivia TaxID=28125 RepID=UPI002550381C|nr:DUF5053 domain-containing protein [Prevotella bivia]MBS6329527.1 DUF5053 domain-containing protein [Prevotella bivia]MDK7763730.1 DUF5053 domain-containing protein [Prevotella bivia]MDU2114619.1 DUF5053 domain-containing protein [Prevotella bivia]